MQTCATRMGVDEPSRKNGPIGWLLRPGRAAIGDALSYLSPIRCWLLLLTSINRTCLLDHCSVLAVRFNTTCAGGLLYRHVFTIRQHTFRQGELPIAFLMLPNVILRLELPDETPGAVEA